MYSNSTLDDKALEETVWRKRRKSQQFFFSLNDGQADNPSDGSPYSRASLANASLSLSFIVAF